MEDPKITITSVKVVAATPDYIAPDEEAAKIRDYNDLISGRRTANEIHRANAVDWGKDIAGPIHLEQDTGFYNLEEAQDDKADGGTLYHFPKGVEVVGAPFKTKLIKEEVWVVVHK